MIAIVLLLAGLPLLARWFLGPAGDTRLARFLRAGGYAAVLALMAAKAGVPRFGDAHRFLRAARFSSLVLEIFSWSSWPGTWLRSSP